MKTPFFLVLATACTSHAAVTAIAATGANSATFIDDVLQTVTANGVTYSTSSLVQVQLTATAHDGNSAHLLIQNTGQTGTITLSEAERRALLESDWRADTGLANIASGNGDKLTGTFNSPIVNRPGIDIFVFELGGSDAMSISVDGGSPLTWQSGAYGPGLTNVNTKILNLLNDAGTGNKTGETSLTQLLNNALNVAISSSTQNVGGVGIDLSDLGIAEGATISSFGLSGGGSDPVLIFALPDPVPEPSVVLFSALGWLALLRRKR